MASYDGFYLGVGYSFPTSGVYLTERLKSRYFLTTEKAKEIGGQSLILWDGETIEFWVEPPVGSRILSLYVYAYSIGRVRVGVFEDGKGSWDDALDMVSNSNTEQWEKLELSFTADDTKNYFLRLENLPLEQGWTKREKAYIDEIELK